MPKYTKNPLFDLGHQSQPWNTSPPVPDPYRQGTSMPSGVDGLLTHQLTAPTQMGGGSPRTPVPTTYTPKSISGGFGGVPILPALGQTMNGSLSERARIAQGMGYTISNGQAMRTGIPSRSGGFGGAPTYVQLTDPMFDPNRQHGQQAAGPKFDPTLATALLNDTQRMQQAANDQFQRNAEQISGVGQFLGGVRPAMMGTADQSAAMLQGLAGQAEGMGQDQMRQFQGTAAPIMAGVDRDVSAYTGQIPGMQAGVDRQVSMAQGAINAQLQMARQAQNAAIQGFQDRTAQDASVLAMGIRKAADSEMKMARAGINPDGTPMTSAQQADAIARVQFNTGVQVQSAITPIFSQFNTAMAGLRQHLADLEMSGAGMQVESGKLGLEGESLKHQMGRGYLDAANIRSQVGTALSGQMLQAQAGQRELMGIQATLGQASAQIRQAAMLNAIQLEQQGRFNMAQLVQQNPMSVVGTFQNLLALYSATQSLQPARTFDGGGKKNQVLRNPAEQRRQQDPDTSGGREDTDTQEPTGGSRWEGDDQEHSQWAYDGQQYLGGAPSGPNTWHYSQGEIDAARQNNPISPTQTPYWNGEGQKYFQGPMLPNAYEVGPPSPEDLNSQYY